MPPRELLAQAEEVMAEAREVDSFSANLRGRIRGLEEEVAHLNTQAEAMDRHSSLLRQKVISLYQALMRQNAPGENSTPPATTNPPNLTVVPR